MSAALAATITLKVDASGGPDACWPWTGRRNMHGYGMLSFDGREVRAHRAALALATGRRLGPGEMACHRCDNPACCNPAHLFLGTAKDNMRDMVAKGRNRYETRCGEAQSNAKLTLAGVVDIRRRVKAGTSVYSLAKEYGVAHRTAQAAACGVTWAHCTEPPVEEKPVAVRNGDKTHCPHGHEYSEANTVVSARHGRQCRTCRRAHARVKRGAT